jgi:hypothetical protein
MLTGLTFLAVAAAGLFWRGYRRPRPRRWLIPRRPPVRVGAACPAARSPGRPAVADSVRAARACRDGQVEPAALVRSGVIDHLASVAERTAPAAEASLVAAVAEAERLARRLPHWPPHLSADVRPAAELLAARLGATAELRRRWLRDGVRRLAAAFPTARRADRPPTLDTLADLRADVGGLFVRLPGRRSGWWAEAVRCLRWSRSPHVGPALANEAADLVTADPARAAVVLTALRGHRSEAAEDLLLRAATGPAVEPRRAAVGAFGWWDPFDPGAVLAVLHDARLAADADTRDAAGYALARFGDRAALAELTDGLRGDDPAARRRATVALADEGVTWFWPDLDGLAAADDPCTALAAAEAVERLREAAFGLTG